MGGHEVKENQFEVNSPTLYPKNIKVLEAKYKSFWDAQTEKANKANLLKYLDLPDCLGKFGQRLCDMVVAQEMELKTPRSSRGKQRGHTHGHGQTPLPELFDFRQFVSVLEKVYRGNAQQLSRFLWEMYAGKKEKLGEDEVRELLLECAMLSEYNRFLYTGIDTILAELESQAPTYQKRIQSIIQSMSDVYPFPVDSHQMTGYFSFLLPSIGKALEYFAWFKFLQSKNDEAQDNTKEEVGTGEWIEERLDFWPPYLLESDNSKITERNSFLWMLACTIEWNESTWKVIYAATTHGRSLNRLTTQIFDYGGPTILIMSDRNGGIFGAYTTEVWRSKADFREDRTAFLFSLAPHFGIYRATGTDNHHIYLYNNPNPHVQFPVGIGFGGIIRAFRLWINDDLDRGESREICTSFARGKVAQSIMFEVYMIEVWGCGGEKAEIEQQKAKAAKDKEIEKRRKVKKELVMETWDSGPSKYVMDLAGKTGVSDEFLEDVKKIRKMREQQKEEQRKKLNK